MQDVVAFQHAPADLPTPDLLISFPPTVCAATA